MLCCGEDGRESENKRETGVRELDRAMGGFCDGKDGLWDFARGVNELRCKAAENQACSEVLY